MPLTQKSKREAKERERRKFVVKLLSERPCCEFVEPRHRSEVIHEVVMRSHGGSITDPNNCRALCHLHHRWVHDHPKLSQEQGWLKPRFGE